MAWLFVRLRPASMLEGLGYGVTLAVLISLATIVPYWNWYGFPAGFAAGLITENLLVGAVAGLLLGQLLRPGVPVPVARAARAS